MLRGGLTPRDFETTVRAASNRSTCSGKLKKGSAREIKDRDLLHLVVRERPEQVTDKSPAGHHWIFRSLNSPGERPARRAIGDRVQKDEIIGRGTFGTVYIGLDTERVAESSHVLHVPRLYTPQHSGDNFFR